VAADTVGDRSEVSCRWLWNAMPALYRSGTSYYDFWRAYQAVIPDEQHQAVGKESGETTYVERWLRDWLWWLVKPR